ncbi:TIGR03621 family F420-dependent LLM class oxidoreductase [Nocardia abscessus]|uniref:TIGR03621 family F420-dependent LLM class oxidoreductase n=1 Tax=Nocardia TaxID=1817 RepID=UPI001894D5A9|nr:MULTISPECIES: TIGR03621 family F420-dependent LLM class oxidoreductase [Nocardia]MBF6220743.1 TIGR03621 family F420-dependent LLM class oxidoreductase [Nocardia abscessus]MDE1672615.1 TIGR03621 family F420-dependent LLM class oxidoreductase [Nocardia gipuzkoensis]
MTDRPFRFGVRFGASLSSSGSVSWLQDQARKAEELGYDVIMLPDHLGTPSPFPTLAALAAVTTRPRLGTFVLNAAFYNPALLARDVSTTDLLIEGRLELGLGAGWAQEEFDEAGLLFPTAGQRIVHLERTILELRRRFAAGDASRRQQSAPPILVGGSGDRLLAAAAVHADIISLASVPVTERPVTTDTVEQALAERTEYIRAAAGRPIQELELGLTLGAVYVNGHGKLDLTLPRMAAPDLSDDELLALPGVLHGSPGDVAETLQRYREKYHLTHFVVPATSMTGFAKVFSRIR